MNPENPTAAQVCPVCRSLARPRCVRLTAEQLAAEQERAKVAGQGVASDPRRQYMAAGSMRGDVVHAIDVDATIFGHKSPPQSFCGADNISPTKEPWNPDSAYACKLCLRKLAHLKPVPAPVASEAGLREALGLVLEFAEKWADGKRRDREAFDEAAPLIRALASTPAGQPDAVLVPRLDFERLLDALSKALAHERRLCASDLIGTGHSHAILRLLQTAMRPFDESQKQRPTRPATEKEPSK